jgi:hypothetical protein
LVKTTGLTTYWPVDHLITGTEHGVDIAGKAAIPGGVDDVGQDKEP